MKNNLLETIVGAGVIAVAIGFFSFVYATAGVGQATGGYSIVAEFDNVEGINVGSDVRMSGIKIGTVSAQKLDTTSFQAVLTLSVNNSIKLPDDSSAKITSEGLLGAKFISLEVGGSDDILKDGGKLEHTQGALDIWDLIGKALFDKTNK